jgi:hypothetical protein
MTVTVIGNSGRAYSNAGIQGVGIGSLPSGMGWVGLINNAAGDQHIVTLQNIVSGDINQGIFFQASQAVTVEFTLSNIGAIMNNDPASQASVLWGNSLSLTADTITPCDLLFTACRITFPTKGTEVYIGVR